MSVESQNVEKIGIATAHRHIFLCADSTTPKCCEGARSLAAFEFLKRRLSELGLSDGGGVLRTKANWSASARTARLRWSIPKARGIATAIRRCSSASSRSIWSAADSSPNTRSSTTRSRSADANVEQGFSLDAPPLQD